jgi:O-antigen ligase
MTWAALVAAPFLLALLLVVLRDPLRVGLPIFAATVPFGGGLAVGASSFGSASSLAGMLLAAGLAVRFASGARLVRLPSPSIPIWGLFATLAAASVLWSVNRRETAFGVVVLASLALVYMMVAACPVDRQVVRRTENGVLAGGAAVVCYGFYQLAFLGGFPDKGAGQGDPLDGRFGDDLLGANLEAVALLLPLVVALQRTLREPGTWSRVAHGAVAALVLAGVFMTGSRTGTLAVAVAVVALAVATPRESRRPLLVMAGLGLVAGVLVWTLHPAGIAERSFASATSSSGRLDIWAVGLTACPSHCAYGAGWGTFPDVYAATQAKVPGAHVLVGDEGSYQAHNIWLLVVVELGVAGVLLLAAGLAVSIREALGLPPDLRGPPVAALAGLLVALMFLSSMEFKFFWLVLVMVALSRNAALDQPVRTDVDGHPAGSRRGAG